MAERLEDGFAVLSAIAAGAEGVQAIASHLDLGAAAVAGHLVALEAAGFVRRDGDRIVLGHTIASLLDGLVGRSDLAAIAGPTILEAEGRLGLDIEVEVTAATDPIAVLGGERFAIRTDARGRRQLVACVLDNLDQVACLLRADVEEAPPETIEVLGKELAATAEAITKRLPKVRGRDGSRRRPLAH